MSYWFYGLMDMYFELQIAPTDHAIEFDDRLYASIIVLVGPETRIAAISNEWLPRGKIAPERLQYAPEEFYEHTGVAEFGRSDQIYRADGCLAIYMETHGGLPLRMLAQLAAANSDVTGAVFSSDHAATDAFISRVAAAKCHFMRVPPSSRVDTILKSWASFAISDIVCRACSDILVGPADFELRSLPETVWSRVFLRCGRQPAKRLSLIMDLMAWREYLELDEESRECPAVDVISVTNRRFLLENSSFANPIGRECLDTFRCLRLNDPLELDMDWLRHWLGKEETLASAYEALTKATLAGQIKGVLVNDPLECAIEYAQFVWGQICTYVAGDDLP